MMSGEGGWGYERAGDDERGEMMKGEEMMKGKR